MPTWQLPDFEELRELGSGGSGRVVLARYQPTGTEVAIKYLADWLSDDPELLAGFRDEAELMAGLVDPHLVTLYEYVETTAGAAIVMDLLDGVSLRRLLVEDGPLSPEAALTLLKGSLLGLAALHRQGVAHRDYKPDNVIVDDGGGTTLIDYGIAAPVGEIATASGTPRYMAPEQWRGEPSSAATDVYAATATFVECLTGRPVFAGESVPHLLYQHLHTDPPLDDVPEPVRPLAVAGLAKDPADRIGDATALMARLDVLAPEAYGEDWESHGREHLSVRAALLAFLFAHPHAVGVGQAHAETNLGRTSTPGEPGGDTTAGASDGGESIAAAVPSRGAQAGADEHVGRRSEQLAAMRRHSLTLSLGLLLLLAAVLAVVRISGPTDATSAAFDSGAPTRGVVAAPPTVAASPSPAVTPTEPSATPKPSGYVTPSPSAVVTTPPVEPTHRAPVAGTTGTPTVSPTTPPPKKGSPVLPSTPPRPGTP